jgi:hypothetical protein
MKTWLWAFILGQTLAIANTASGVFSNLLYVLGLATAMFQLVWQYFFLVCVYVPIFVY